MRALVPFLAALATSLASAPAFADIYKWVDDAGGVHYSNTPPANPAHKTEVVIEDKISTYPSDPAQMRAMAQAASRIQAENLARRVDYLERELAAQRQANPYAAAPPANAMQSPYDPMYGYGAPYVIYGAPVVIARKAPIRHGHSVRPFSSRITGVTAGKVVTFRSAPAPRTGQHFRSR